MNNKKNIMSYTKKLYKDSIPSLKDMFAYKNDMQVPSLKKVVLNVGVKSVDNDSKFLSYLLEQVSMISGQKAVLVQSKKSIAGFKLREGMTVGCRVTLRKKNMYNFLDKLIYISMPRIRDFRGLSDKAFNQTNHYSFGINDHSIFLEVNLDNIVKTFGMNITLVSDARTREEAMALLKKIRLPIKNKI